MSLELLVEKAATGLKQVLQEGLSELLAQAPTNAGTGGATTTLGRVLSLAEPVAEAIAHRVAETSFLGREVVFQGSDHLTGLQAVVVGQSPFNSELICKLTSDGYAGQLVQVPAAQLNGLI